MIFMDFVHPCHAAHAVDDSSSFFLSKTHQNIEILDEAFPPREYIQWMANP